MSKVAIYLQPSRATSVEHGEDYQVASPELTKYLDALQPRGRIVMVPLPEVRSLLQTLQAYEAADLHLALHRLDDAHVVMLVRRD